MDEQPRPDATNDRYVTQLESENVFLRAQNDKKDQQLERRDRQIEARLHQVRVQLVGHRVTQERAGVILEDFRLP